MSQVFPGVGAMAGLLAGAIDPAFPVFQDVTRGNVGNPSGITLPATVNAGDLLIIFVSGDGTAGADTDNPAGYGFTLQFNTSYNSGANQLYCWSKVANGSEGGASIGLVSSSPWRVAWHIYRFAWAGGAAPSSPYLEYSTAATGTSTAPNPSNLAPTFGSGKTAWIAVEASDTQTGDVSAYPTNYTSAGIYDECAQANGCGIGSSYRTNQASSEDPGAFTIGASVPWVAVTLAIREG